QAALQHLLRMRMAEQRVAAVADEAGAIERGLAGERLCGGGQRAARGARQVAAVQVLVDDPARPLGAREPRELAGGAGHDVAVAGAAVGLPAARELARPAQR